ncbi:MAG: DUF882 domain-containing protein [Gammaproteobacteria bacterium]
MSWNRRRVLRAGGALAGMSAAALLGGRSMGADTAAALRAVRSTAGSGDRRIALLNLNTEERLALEYSHDGTYVPEALSAIEVLLRDFRSGERHVIDPSLLDYLVEVAHTVGADPSFSVISGYRSPQTNAVLHEKSAGVAQHSLHMEGRAIDVRMTGVDCASLAAHAEDLKWGGVGYYRASNFVHLDTGAFRTWKG